MWSVPPWSVRHISLKYMSYCSRPENVAMKEKRLTEIHFFPFNIIQLLFLLKVTHHFLGPFCGQNAWDAAAWPRWHGNWLQYLSLPWRRPYWCIHMLLHILQPSFFHSHLLMMSSLYSPHFFCQTFYLLFTLFPNLHHPHFFCSPFSFGLNTVELASPLPVCLSLQAIKLAIVCFITLSTQIHNAPPRKVKGDLHLKKVIKANKRIQ